MNHDIIDPLFNYQNLVLMSHALDTGDRSCLNKDALRMVEKMPNFIRYQYRNMLKWLSLSDVLTGRRQGKSVHDDPGFLENYVLGLYERNSFVWSATRLFDCLNFARNANVLDFGCGSCFYTKAFCQISNLVIGYDRGEVLRIAHNRWGNCPSDGILPDNYTSVAVGAEERIDQLVKKGFKINVVFLSEVLHGKSVEEVESVMALVRRFACKDALIVINELSPLTAEGANFRYNMLANDRNGDLHTAEALIKMTGIRNVTISRSMGYHFMVGGTL